MRLLMKPPTTLLLVLLFILASGSRAAEISDEFVSKRSHSTVVWSIIPYAPIHILEGEFIGKGIADQYLQEAQAFLSQYNHINQIMTPARAWHQITTKDQLVCHPSALKTAEKETYAYFTKAALITPVLRVLMRKSIWENDYQKQESIKISDYLAQNKGSLGVVSHRSYGEQIDKVIAQAIREDRKIIQASGRYGSRQLYEMLINGRIDIMLEYPWVSAYFKRIVKKNDVVVVNINISDFPRYSPAYVACSYSAEGKKIIEALNAFIDLSIPLAKNRQRMMNWLDDQEAKKFEQDYFDFFKIAH